MILSGTITAAEKDFLNEEERFTITYHPESLNVVNSHRSTGLNVSPSAHVDYYVAWDGVLRSHGVCLGEKGVSSLLTRPTVTLERWLTPQTIAREMVNVEGTPSPGYRMLPVLTIRYKGFLLKFRVGSSSINGAGFGVFLSISKAMDEVPNELRLEAGELLDFGVYAPYRAEDIRSDHEFLVKSLLHDGKNEVYAWESNTQENYLDITDNSTGELHMIARTHVHPFVNEIQDPSSEIPCVVARADPEGAVHYLLGHAPKDSNEPFVFPADGSEAEIFVDYEQHYEMVVRDLSY